MPLRKETSGKRTSLLFGNYSFARKQSKKNLKTPIKEITEVLETSPTKVSRFNCTSQSSSMADPSSPKIMRKPVTKSSSQNNFVADAFKLEPNFCKRKTTPKFVVRSPCSTSEYKPLQSNEFVSQEESKYRRVDSMPIEKALMCRTSS